MVLKTRNKFLNLLLILICPAAFTFSQNYISYTFPDQNQVYISRTAQIKVAFTEQIDTATLNNNSVVVNGLLSGKHWGEIEYDSNNDLMIYTSLDSFACGERVFVTLTGEIKNLAGIPMTPPYSFSFFVKSNSGHNIMGNTKQQDISELVGVDDFKAVDIDRDGDYDLVFTSNSTSLNKVSVYLNDGSADFQISCSVQLPQRVTHLSIGDYNNDGMQDVAAQAGNKLYILPNDGSGQLTGWGNPGTLSSCFLVSCDFNNDGNIDVLGLEAGYGGNPDSRIVSFMKNLGNGNFQKIRSYEFYDNSYENFNADIADLNNDGFTDLIISRVGPDQVFLLLNNGEGEFAEGAVENIEGSPYSFALGDFDGDLDVDLSIGTDASSVYNGLKIYENLGNSTFNYAQSFYLHSFPCKTVCTDFNNDGNLDVASVFGYGGRIGIYFGTSTLVFSWPYDVWFSNAILMEYADFDGDGDVDLIALDEYYADRKLYFLENGESSNPIPVELSVFNYINVSNGVLLNWVTSSEINNKGFELFRDSALIAFIDGNGTTLNTHHYTYLDTIMVRSAHSYELIQLDFNGDTKSVGELNINYDPEIYSFLLSQNYPNPFNPVTTIQYQIPERSNVTVKVFGLLGEVVKTLINEELETGIYKVEFNANDLPAGVYFYRIQAGEFVQTKKMVLLK